MDILKVLTIIDFNNKRHISCIGCIQNLSEYNTKAPKARWNICKSSPCGEEKSRQSAHLEKDYIYSRVGDEERGIFKSFDAKGFCSFNIRQNTVLCGI